MLKKIKNIFESFINFFQSGFWAKLSILLWIIILFIIYYLIFGNSGIFKTYFDYKEKNKLSEILYKEKQLLKKHKHHIKLIENYSKDYTEELSIKHLNIAHPDAKILKIY